MVIVVQLNNSARDFRLA